MNLKYNNLWENDKISESYEYLFKKKKNMFCYYILKTIF